MTSTGKYLWEPAIYEHKAALIKKPVVEVANSVDLLTEAILAEHRVYQADLITVGVDVYNIEAEACGATVVAGEKESCPYIPDPLFDIHDLPKELDLPAISQAGRFGLMLEVGQRVSKMLSGQCSVRIAASGPVSIAGKLVGLEPLILALAMGEACAYRLLDFATELSRSWCLCLREHGLDVIIFDSMAAPPLVSPDMYTEIVLPRHRQIMETLTSSGQSQRPLIIGGDTTVIAAAQASSGATTILCDFPANAETFARSLPKPDNVVVRRNVVPSIFSQSALSIETSAERLRYELDLFANPIAGTGILPYETDPENVIRFKKALIEDNG